MAKGNYRHAIAIASLIVTTAGCGATGGSVGSKSAYDARDEDTRVIINRDTVEVMNGRGVLELLQGAVGRRRLSADALGKSPLVVIDGIPLSDDGMSVLTRMPASDIRSITTLWPSEATYRFGTAATNGAIVVVTRSGARRTRAGS